jgi:hypothetical protein
MFKAVILGTFDTSIGFIIRIKCLQGNYTPKIGDTLIYNNNHLAKITSIVISSNGVPNKCKENMELGIYDLIVKKYVANINSNIFITLHNDRSIK